MPNFWKHEPQCAPSAAAVDYPDRNDFPSFELFLCHVMTSVSKISPHLHALLHSRQTEDDRQAIYPARGANASNLTIFSLRLLDRHISLSAMPVVSSALQRLRLRMQVKASFLISRKGEVELFVLLVSPLFHFCIS